MFAVTAGIILGAKIIDNNNKKAKKEIEKVQKNTMFVQ